MDDAATDTAPTEQPHPQPEVSTAPDTMPAGRSPRALAWFVLVSVVVFAGDQVLKYLAFAHVAGVPVQLDPDRPSSMEIPHHDPIPVVPEVLSLRLTTNPGAVFGLGKGGRWVFVAVSIVAIGVILRIFWRSPAAARGLHGGLALILAGAMGNLYDRLVYAVVRDMLWLFPGTNLWPWIFNLADAALMVGVATVVGLTWWHELRQSRTARSDRD